MLLWKERLKCATPDDPPKWEVDISMVWLIFFSVSKTAKVQHICVCTVVK